MAFQIGCNILRLDEMFGSIYKNKRILVTGHTGFKGSWLAIWLKRLGAQVIGYSLDPPTEPNNFQATRLEEKIVHIHGDIRDLDHLLSAFKQHRPEFVFHLAAQSLVLISYDEPKLTFDTNVGGTVNVFEAVRKSPNVKTLVNITSDKCYENRDWVWGYRENDSMGGQDPYSASKGCAELVFNAYLRSYFLKKAIDKGAFGAASVRAGNVIGGGDWGKDRLVPDCIRALGSGQKIRIRNPLAVRPWQHVLEPLGAYLLLGAKLWNDPQKYSGPWNFGPDEGSYLTVATMADNLVQLWGRGAWEDVSYSDPPHEANLLKLNCDKARAELHWRNALSISECLQMTVKWYKEYYSRHGKKDMYKFCMDQIYTYEKIQKNRKRVLNE
jgi:CDP-glucose 4,6-dehydratase